MPDRRPPSELSSSADSPRSGSTTYFISDLLRFAIIALVIVVPFRLFIAQPFIVNGASMTPTFHSGEYLIVDQVSYQFDNPSRGDVIVFRFPENTSKYYIKRIIGLPGETVEITDGTVMIYNDEWPDGRKLVEPYIEEHARFETKTTLGEGEYFVLGDNRQHSSDSRSWGALEREFIEGRPAVRLFPIGKFNVLPGVSDYSQSAD